MQLTTDVHSYTLYVYCLGLAEEKIYHAARVTKNNTKWQFHFVVHRIAIALVLFLNSRLLVVVGSWIPSISSTLRTRFFECMYVSGTAVQRAATISWRSYLDPHSRIGLSAQRQWQMQWTQPCICTIHRRFGRIQPSQHNTQDATRPTSK